MNDRDLELTDEEFNQLLDELTPADRAGMLSYLSGSSPWYFLRALHYARRPDLIPERLQKAAETDPLDRATELLRAEQAAAEKTGRTDQS